MSSSFLADKREIEFLLFEYLQMEDLLQQPYFANHTKESLLEMLSSCLTFCDKIIGPLNKPGDKIGCLHDKQTKKVTTPKGMKEAYLQFVQNGFLTLSDEENYGGLEAPETISVCFMELFSAANQSFAIYPGLTKSAMHVIGKFGEEWMKKVCIPNISSGKWTGTMCLTEPSVGSAVGDLKTSAKKQADGSFLIKGIKQWISGGEHDLSENIIHLVLARVEGAPMGMDGVSLFLVPKIRIDKHSGQLKEANDVHCISLEEKLGIHANATCLMSFGDGDQCEGFLIGKENQGISYMFLMMNEERIMVGLQGIGIASAAFLNAEKYAKERVQGMDISLKKDSQDAKRVCIVEHPDVRRMLLRQRAIVEGGRTLSYFAAKLQDLSRHAASEEIKKKSHTTLELLTPVVKAWCTDMGFEVVVLAMQTYGGYGYTKDYPVEQYLRDLKIASIYEGTNGIQALDFLGRKVFMQQGQVFQGWITEQRQKAQQFKEQGLFSEEWSIVEYYLEELQNAVNHVQRLFAQKKQKEAVLNASSFLMAFGHVIIGSLILEQGVLACEKQKDTSISSLDKKFYRNKIITARFFIHQILPEAKSYLAKVFTEDVSALDFDFS